MNWRPTFLKDPEPDPAELEAEAERAKATAAMVRRFRDTRVLAGLSFADVERDTRINRAYLEAIEDGRFGDIPAPIYARGFVRSYARYLGLNPEEAVAAMPKLPPPLGLEPMAGLRRTVAPALPAVNLPAAGGIAAALLLAIVAYLFLPIFGGGGDEPAGTVTATASVTSTVPGTSTATTEAGVPPTTATVPPFNEGTAPDFTGVSRATAQATIANLDLTPLFVDAASEAPAGTIFDQSPSPGTEVEAGDVITLFVSTGP